MATYALVPGADGSAWYWHRIVPGLRARGHQVVTLDLPGEPTADLDAFADAITDAIGEAVPDADAAGSTSPAPGSGDDAGPLIVVAQSLGGFSAPLVCARRTVDRLVLVNAMVPRPGETAGEWWGNTGQAEARAAHAASIGRRGADAEFDVRTDFFHDVPPGITDEAFAAEPGGPPAGIFAQPWPLARWPDVPTRFLQGRDDRFFPLDFQRRVVRDRLGPGVEVEELPGGHLVALSRPEELLAALLRED
ncbi:alpha/beta fold hydrolase [Streptomyces polygonati]|uniref:Alpha/beta fold hydrolase n=1 Tax=Streptomyces polygonati TaxID=1617087 RepID=A0ABV8HGC4_9ACTN